MKLKKRYIVACVLMCIVAIALGAAVLFMEMGLARYTKLNRVTKNTWIETSASELGTRLSTDLMITKVYAPDGSQKFGYIGKQVMVDGKCTCYNRDIWVNNIVLNGKNRHTGKDYKIGDKLSIYYKPDNPRLIYVYTNCTPYIILIGVCFLAAIIIVVVCKLISKAMKENTFSEANITIMDIPMFVVLISFILCFFAGMLIGNLQVDKTYTAIDQTVAERIASGDVSF